MGIKGSRKNKSPPIMSHEFVIQNHADIVSCVAMVFVLGLMFQATSSLATIFVTVSHNVPVDEKGSDPAPPATYTNGPKDIAAIFFYSLITIVVHAVIQEYLLDKVAKKLHLSKSKVSKFNESGQLLIFSLLATVWGINIIVKDGVLSDLSSLWSGYPEDHIEMSFMLKFFFVIQLAYWIHCFPELYFQKAKKDEVPKRIQYATLYLLLIAGAYIFNFTHVGLVLLILRFLEESILHVCKLLHFSEKDRLANTGFRVWNIVFVMCLLVSFIVSILTFYYGLATLENQNLDIAAGNFNTFFIRFNSLVCVCLVQLWMLWNFMQFHMKRIRERKGQSSQPKITTFTRSKSKKAKKQAEDDVALLPEADQNARRRK